MTIIVDEERDDFGGPRDCTAKCSECPIPFQVESVDGPRAAFIDRHHFNEAMTTDCEEEPDHPAAKLGHEAWYCCKHCDAWVLDLDCEDDE